MKKLIIILSILFAFISSNAIAQTLKFTWDANSEPDLVGYRLYRTLTSGVYDFGEFGLNLVDEIECPPSDTSCTTTTDTVSEYDTTYYWVVTAYDSERLESGPSNEVSYTTGSPPWVGTPPANPGGLRLEEVNP